MGERKSLASYLENLDEMTHPVRDEAWIATCQNEDPHQEGGAYSAFVTASAAREALTSGVPQASEAMVIWRDKSETLQGYVIPENDHRSQVGVCFSLKGIPGS